MERNDQISYHIVQQKVELIADILRDLAQNHDFHFNFNYSLLSQNSKKIIVIDRFINRNINTPVLGMFIQDLVEYKVTRDIIIDSVGQGKLVVMCTNDTAKPEDVTDWPVQGSCYLVESVYNTYETDGCNLFRLAGLNPYPYKGYKSNRFTQLFTLYNQN